MRKAFLEATGIFIVSGIFLGYKKGKNKLVYPKTLGRKIVFGVFGAILLGIYVGTTYLTR